MKTRKRTKIERQRRQSERSLESQRFALFHGKRNEMSSVQPWILSFPLLFFFTLS